MKLLASFSKYFEWGGGGGGVGGERERERKCVCVYVLEGKKGPYDIFCCTLPKI